VAEATCATSRCPISASAMIGFHYQGQEVSPARHALNAAQALGLPHGSISIDQPRAEAGIDKDQPKGAPVIAGGVMFRGRAVEKLTSGLPFRPWQ
jgi:hypothetical protein